MTTAMNFPNTKTGQSTSRKRFRLLIFSLLLLGVALLALEGSPIRGQDPVKKRPSEEEEEAPKARPKVPIRIDEEPKTKATPSAPANESPTISLTDEGRFTRIKGLRDFYYMLATPYDLLVTTSDERIPIEPHPEHDLPKEELLFKPSGKKITQKLAIEGIRKIIPYEEVVVTEVQKFIKKRPEDVSRLDALEAAVKVYGFALRFHDSAKEQKKRVGRGWDVVQSSLKKTYQQALKELFISLADAKEWERADQLGQQLSSNFPDDPDVQRIWYRLQLMRSEQTLNSGNDGDYLTLRDALTQYEKQTTGSSKDLLIETVRKRLREKAEELLKKAKDLAIQNQNAAALGKLRTAEALDPDLAGIADLKIRLKDRILYVGVSRLPEKMSPATARTDAEKWAVELIFESLVQAIPDADLGRRFRPMLSDTMPRVVTLGREFDLLKNVRWTQENGKDFLDARDVRGTLNLLKKQSQSWVSDGIDLLEGIDKIEDPHRMRLNFKQGVLEPLTRLNFKILPAQYLLKNNLEMDDDRFSRSPFGTGPYRYDGREKESGDRECAVFRANPYYASRSGKFGLPVIREIRMFVPKTSNLANDLQTGQCHLLADVTTPDYLRFRDDPSSAQYVRTYTASNNRRIWILAVNHRKPILQSVEARRGIAHAIDREEILKDVFRVEGSDFHKALTGPFPVKSWATPPKSSELFKLELASSALSEYLAKNRRLQIGLKYPIEDPKATFACQRIKAMIEKAAGANTEIFLQPVPAEQLQKNVEMDHDYELAYIPFDYKDELFRLDGLFDPAATGRGGRNFLGYLGDTTTPMDRDRRLRQTIQEIRLHRDFNKQVKEKTWEVHQLFNQQMPFIPLWQLDRHLLIATGLEVYFEEARNPAPPSLIDPSALFTGVERWRIK